MWPTKNKLNSFCFLDRVDFRVDFFVYSELIIPVINVPNEKQIKLWEEEEE